MHPQKRSGCPRPPRCLWHPLSPRTVPAGGSLDFQLAAASAAPGAAGSGPAGCQDAPDGRQEDAGAGRPGRQRGAPGAAAVPNWGSSPLNPIRYCEKKDERAGESLQTLLIKACTIFCIPKSRQPPALPQDTSGSVSGTAWTGSAARRAAAAGGTRGGTGLRARLLPAPGWEHPPAFPMCLPLPGRNSNAWLRLTRGRWQEEPSHRAPGARGCLSCHRRSLPSPFLPF